MTVGHLGPCGYRGESGTWGGATLSVSTTPVGLFMVMMAAEAYTRAIAAARAMS